MTLGEVLALPSHRFTELIAFFEIEPFGPTRDNLHAAQLTSLIYNRGVSKRHKVKSPQDFMWRDQVDTRTTREKVHTFIESLRTLVKR